MCTFSCDDLSLGLQEQLTHFNSDGLYKRVELFTRDP